MRFSVKLENTTTMSTDILFEPGIVENGGLAEKLEFLNNSSNHFLISDNIVFDLYGEKILTELKKLNKNVTVYLVEPSEVSKSIDYFAKTIEFILNTGLNKESYIISLGGGVVSNLAGFVASTLYRGLNFINIPTTSLAQVDAAIDFKQAVNYKHGKNLVGSFYPAKKVVIDPHLLKTLDHRNFINGFSESIKHALVQDESFYETLVEFADKDFSDDKLCHYVVKKSIELKMEVMQNYMDDPTMYKEMTKQYGHSIGHAIEHVSEGQIYHGEAVAIGMYMSAVLANRLGFAEEGIVEKHANILQKYKLPFKLPRNINVEEVINTIRYDKHYVKVPKMMLLESVGKPVSVNDSYDLAISYSDLEKVLVSSDEA